MKLYIIRHGETEWNKKVLLQGMANIPLNEDGRRLACLTGQKLLEIPFYKAFSSPLIRAMETARLVLGERDIPIIADPRITEMSFGKLEGKCYAPGSSDIPAEMLDNFFHHTEAYQVPEGGESFSQVIERTHELYQELVLTPEYEDKNILISSHGASSRAFLQSVFQDGNFWQNGVPKNCAVTIVEIVNRKVVHVELDHLFYKE